MTKAPTGGGALAAALKTRPAGAALQHAPELPRAAPAPEATKRPGYFRPSRAGKVALTVHLTPDARRALRVLAAEQDRSLEDCAAEALNLLFAKYRRPELAQRKC